MNELSVPHLVRSAAFCLCIVVPTIHPLFAQQQFVDPPYRVVPTTAIKPEGWLKDQLQRGADNVMIAQWLYSITKDATLLDLAQQI